VCKYTPYPWEGKACMHAKLFLKPGDRLEASIEKIGTLRNHIVAK
jgi:2-keto-4-pentenoate hydratase/2-oxohepta-3-ene-1,7-dioic acid hydratase in catechol pathway